MPFGSGDWLTGHPPDQGQPMPKTTRIRSTLWELGHMACSDRIVVFLHAGGKVG